MCSTWKQKGKGDGSTWKKQQMLSRGLKLSREQSMDLMCPHMEGELNRPRGKGAVNNPPLCVNISHVFTYFIWYKLLVPLWSMSWQKAAASMAKASRSV
jgi:hypothetical protein